MFFVLEEKQDVKDVLLNVINVIIVILLVTISFVRIDSFTKSMTIKTTDIFVVMAAFA